MENRTLEITVMSARDLNKVNLISKMDVYVVVSIAGDVSKQVAKTPVDKDGGSNPTWNFPIKFTVDEAAAQQNRLSLVFKIRCERALGDKDVGEVHVSIKELLDSPESRDGKKQFVSYQVRKPDGKPKGFISFGYQFGDKVVKKADEPVTAYPPPNLVGPSSGYPPPATAYPPPPGAAAVGAAAYTPPNQGAYPPPPAAAAVAYPPPPHKEGGYPPPPQHHGAQPPVGYPPPPQYAGYGYPPQQPYGGYPPPPPHGYGYPPQPGYGYPPVQKPPKKNKFGGLGLGAGLLGGALGGMLIGDMVSDAAAYDAGYDAGFDDAGFEF